MFFLSLFHIFTLIFCKYIINAQFNINIITYDCIFFMYEYNNYVHASCLIIESEAILLFHYNNFRVSQTYNRSIVISYVCF